MKTCTRCGQDLPLDSFYFVNQQRGNTRRGECKSCVRDVKRAQRDGTWRPSCIHCGVELEGRRSGRRLCGTCRDEAYDTSAPRPRAGKMYYNKLKPCTLCGGEKRRGARSKLCDACRPYADQAQRLRRHGLTPVQYESILDAQGGLCAICLAEPEDRRRLAIDHRHDSGFGIQSVRGLLCNRCNYQRLPLFNDSPDLLRSAIDYLERPPAPMGIARVTYLNSPPANDREKGDAR